MSKFAVVLLALLLSGCDEGTDELAARKGMVNIVTKPGDAKIFINGKRKGNSPAKPWQTFAIKLPEGEYVVEAVKEIDKFREYRGKKTVFVSEDSLQTIDFELNRRFTELGKKKESAKKKAKAARIAKVIKSIKSSMVKISGGTFRMGCLSGKGCDRDEKPIHRVTVSTFYLSKYELIFDQWDACVADGGCTHYPNDKGWGRGNLPVINVSWNDAVQYVKWLSRKTGQTWRLPTEAEWEYAARAGSETKYSWGNSVSKNKANCDGCGSHWDNKKTAPIGSFSANKFGLHDMHGNVWEWCQDWYAKYRSISQTDPKGPSSGSLRVLRGGSWNLYATDLRSAYRNRSSPVVRNYFLGFRLVRQP